jgi:hypothetical protein
MLNDISKSYSSSVAVADLMWESKELLEVG